MHIGSVHDKISALSEIPQYYSDYWKEMLETVATVLDVPVALINRVDQGALEVFASNTHEDNSFTVGQCFPMPSGMYCESVLSADEMVFIKDANIEEEWIDGPGAEQGYINYLGYPIHWPNNQVFGIICILNTDVREYSNTHHALLRQFVLSIQKDLAGLIRETELRNSRDMYDRLFDDATDALFVHDTEGTIIEVNKKVCHLFGYSREELLQMRPWDLSAPDFLGKGPDRISKIIEHGSYCFRTVMLHKNGTRIPLEISTTYFDDEPHGVIFAIVRELADRLLPEEALADSNARLLRAQALAKIGDWTIEVDNHNAVIASAEARRMYGFDTVGAVLSITDILQRIHPDERRLVLNTLGSAVKDGTAFNLDYRIVRPDGEIRYLTIESEVIFNSEGVVSKIFGTSQDITERKLYEMELEESQKKFRELIEDLGDNIVVFRYDLEGRVLYASPGGRTVFGVDPDEVLGQNLLEFINWTPGTTDRIRKSIGMLNNEGRVAGTEYSFIHPDGSTRTISSNSHAVKGPDGTVLYIDGRAEDITSRKEMEVALQQSEERFNLAITATNEGIWDIDLAAETAFYSARYKKMLGYEDHEIENSFDSWMPLLHPEDRERILHEQMDILNSDKTRLNFHLKMLHKNGSIVHIHSQSIIIRDEQGKAIRMIGTHQDVTEQRELEQRLRIFQQFADASGQGFAIADLAGIPIYVNQTLLDMFKIDDVSKILEEHVASININNEQLLVRDEILPLLLEQGHWQGETRQRRWDGTWIHTIENYFLIRDEKGQPLYLADVITPIDEIKEKESQLREARSAAEAASRAKSEFLTNMSHELRTPLNAIIGMSHLALESTIPPKLRHYLERIDKGAKILRDIIGDILDFSEIETDNIEIEHAEFSVESILVQVTDLVAIEAAGKGLEIHVDLASEVPARIIGDALRTTQVLNNLMNNAVKFTEHGDILFLVREILTDSEAREIEFVVQDSGIGMSKEQIDNLFNVFTQVDGSMTRQYGGSGLGLTICKRLVELMGGTLEVASTPRQGSTFTVRLPLVEASSKQQATSAYDVGSHLKGKRVLIVDHNIIAQSTISKTVARFGMEAVCADAGDDLKALISANDAEPFSLLLIGHEMPGHDGIKVAETLSSLGTTRPPMLLMTSVHWEGQILNHAFEAGFQSIISKPILPGQMATSISNAFTSNQGMDEHGRVASPAQKFDEGLKGKILLVEDNEINEEVVYELLQRMGLDVEVARNGKEAILLIKKHAFDAVLMDVQMPGMDGLTATNYIRGMKIPNAESIPIIAMTAHALEGDRERCIEAGMSDYISKPVDPDKLYSTLLEWLDSDHSIQKLDITLPAFHSSSRWINHLDAHGITAFAALRQIVGNEEFFIRMLRSFVDDYSTVPENIAAALSTKDYEEARQLAHSLKNVSGYIGAVILTETLVELSKALKTESPMIPEILEQFTNEMTAIVAVIKNALLLIEQDEETEVNI